MNNGGLGVVIITTRLIELLGEAIQVRVPTLLSPFNVNSASESGARPVDAIRLSVTLACSIFVHKHFSDVEIF